MKQPFSEEQVEEAYGAVLECLGAVEQHFSLCAALHTRYKAGSSMEAIPLKPGEVEGIVAGLRDLVAAMSSAQRLIEPLDSELPALADGPVESPGIVASSWAEATVLIAEAYVGRREGWERLLKSDKKEQHALFDRVFSLMPTVPRFKANLKRERALLRERARAMSPEVRYAYEFMHLKPQSRRLFEVLAYSQRRRVEFQRIAVEVCDDPRASNDRITQAKSRLKAELKHMGSARVAESIETEEGAYRLGGSR